jgi:hypothetical protein
MQSQLLASVSTSSTGGFGNPARTIRGVPNHVSSGDDGIATGEQGILKASVAVLVCVRKTASTRLLAVGPCWHEQSAYTTWFPTAPHSALVDFRLTTICAIRNPTNAAIRFAKAD